MEYRHEVASAGGTREIPLYETIGAGYSAVRRPDPRIEMQIHRAIGRIDGMLLSDDGEVSDNVFELYLTVADVVVEAVAAPEVGAAWDKPSVLEDQTIGGLAGHLARGGVWLVGEYLDAGVPNGPITRESAGGFCVRWL